MKINKLSKIRDTIEFIFKSRRKNSNRFTFDPDSFVVIKHGDGTTYQFTNAFCEHISIGKEKILLVFTEHNNYHWFFIDELMEEDGLSIYKRIRDQVL